LSRRLSGAWPRLVLCAALAFAGCGKPPAPPAAAPPGVVVTKPIKRTVIDWDEYTGHLQAPEMATVQARVSGFIEQTPFTEGALVKKGDVLFVIDARPFQADLDNKKAAVAKDEAGLALTEAQLSRYEDLLQKKAVAQQDFDTNKANNDQALAQLAADRAAAQTAELNLEWTKVTAPIDGRVGRIAVTLGNLVNGGAGQATVLTTIVSVNPLYCYAPIPERSFLKYQRYAEHAGGDSVREANIPCFIKLEGEAKFGREGVIDFIDNRIDTTTGTIQVRGVIKNPKGELTPGLFAQLRITATGPYEAILVPDVAIGTEQSERYVLAVGADNTANSIPVELGRLFGPMRAIKSGLKGDERVIVEGLQLARQGAKVNPREAPLPEASIKALEEASPRLDAKGKPIAAQP
jgi:RND family efflux transporter MFP subunit